MLRRHDRLPVAHAARLLPLSGGHLTQSCRQELRLFDARRSDPEGVQLGPGSEGLVGSPPQLRSVPVLGSRVPVYALAQRRGGN